MIALILLVAGGIIAAVTISAKLDRLYVTLIEGLLN